jgi:hypothetical protein
MTTIPKKRGNVKGKKKVHKELPKTKKVTPKKRPKKKKRRIKVAPKTKAQWKKLADELEKLKDERQLLKAEIHDLQTSGKESILQDMPLKDLVRFAMREGITEEEFEGMSPLERQRTVLKTMTPSERLHASFSGMSAEERRFWIQDHVQKKMERARRLYGDTLMTAYDLVDELEDFGYDSINMIYDLWESDPDMVA